MDKVLVPAAGYVVFCSGADGGKHEKKNHEVGIAVIESIVVGVDKGEVSVECISARLMKVRFQLKGKPYCLPFIVAMLPLSTRAPAKMITLSVN